MLYVLMVEKVININHRKINNSAVFIIISLVCCEMTTLFNSLDSRKCIANNSLNRLVSVLTIINYMLHYRMDVSTFFNYVEIRYA